MLVIINYNLELFMAALPALSGFAKFSQFLGFRSSGPQIPGALEAYTVPQATQEPLTKLQNIQNKMDQASRMLECMLEQPKGRFKFNEKMDVSIQVAVILREVCEVEGQSEVLHGVGAENLKTCLKAYATVHSKLDQLRIKLLSVKKPTDLDPNALAANYLFFQQKAECIGLIQNKMLDYMAVIREVCGPGEPSAEELQEAEAAAEAAAAVLREAYEKACVKQAEVWEKIEPMLDKKKPEELNPFTAIMILMKELDFGEFELYSRHVAAIIRTFYKEDLQEAYSLAEYVHDSFEYNKLIKDLNRFNKKQVAEEKQ